MLEIPDIFWGRTVDAGPEPMYIEKIRVPTPGEGGGTLILSCIRGLDHLGGRGRSFEFQYFLWFSDK